MSFHGLIRAYDRRKGAKGRALSGLSYCVKDAFSVKNNPLTFGLLPALIEECRDDAAIIKALDACGAELLGSANMDPAGVSSKGENPFYGDIKNPVNPKIMSGGSSGGSAAAVASRNVDFALGTDHGGSIRIPAAFCEVNALLLSAGSFDRSGVVLLDEVIDRVGYFTRTPDLMRRVIEATGRESRSTLLRSAFIPHESDLAVCSGYVREEFSAFIDKRVKKILPVSSLPAPDDFQRALSARKLLIPKLFKELMARFRYPAEELPAEAAAVYRFADTIAPEEVTAASEVSEELTKSIRGILGENGVIITPALPDAVLKLNGSTQDLNYFMPLANLTGLPAYLFTDGIPIQVIAPLGADSALIDLVKKLSPDN